MSSPVPIILCGKIPSHQKAVPEAMKPDYEVLDHVIPTVEVFADLFPKLMNDSDPSRRPVAVFMGAGFDREEFDTAYAIPGASSIPWFRPIRTKPGNEHMIVPNSQAPPAEKVAALARGKLDEYIEEIRAGNGKGEIWYY